MSYMKDIYYEEEELNTITQAINRLAFYSKTTDKFANFVQRINAHMFGTMDWLAEERGAIDQVREDEALRLYNMNQV